MDRADQPPDVQGEGLCWPQAGRARSRCTPGSIDWTKPVPVWIICPALSQGRC